LAAAAVRAAVAALEVAAIAEAAPAAAALAVAALAVAAFAEAALVVDAAFVAAAARARAASVPPVEAVIVLPVARAGRAVFTGRSDVDPSAVVWADPLRCDFPLRCVGTVLGAFS